MTDSNQTNSILQHHRREALANAGLTLILAGMRSASTLEKNPEPVDRALFSVLTALRRISQEKTTYPGQMILQCESETYLLLYSAFCVKPGDFSLFFARFSPDSLPSHVTVSCELIECVSPCSNPTDEFPSLEPEHIDCNQNGQLVEKWRHCSFKRRSPWKAWIRPAGETLK